MPNNGCLANDATDILWYSNAQVLLPLRLLEELSLEFGRNAAVSQGTVLSQLPRLASLSLHAGEGQEEVFSFSLGRYALCHSCQRVAAGTDQLALAIALCL